ncbi:MAG: family 78 glycoside hydrolase catalytic domain [Alistipes sp.]|nr:family 78 glycoside hydrolase catalytic domain [Alistipes sp.]
MMKTVALRVRRSVIALMSMLAITLLCSSRHGISVEDMRVEYSVAPKNVDGDVVRFTWTYCSKKGEAFTQNTVKVCVAQSQKALKAGNYVVSSGREQAPFQRVTLSTENLKSYTDYCWQVVLYDAAGDEICRSDVEWFSTANLRGEPWQAKWITDAHDKNYLPAPMLRKRFYAEGKVKRALLHISAAGYYDAKINGKRVSEDWLNPGYTHYDKRNLYLTHDVTALIGKGDNVITATLGNGFYNEYAAMAVWQFDKAEWRNRPRMIAELHIEYANGEKDVVVTDNSWKTTEGEVRCNVIYAGDVIDARKRVESWDDPAMDDSAYPAAVEVEAPSALLLAQKMPAIRTVETVAPKSMKKFSDQHYLFAFSENMAGVTTLKVKGEAGTRIEVEHGELLKKDSTLEVRNINIYYHTVGDATFQQDVYILRGDEQGEEFTPRFHYCGFQYVSVRSDRPIELDMNSIKAHFLSTDMESVGEFNSSNDLFNKLWRAVRRSYQANFYGIPTDCPHREKNGWTADAHISMDIALTNFDGLLAYEKWIDDHVDNQHADGRISGIIPSSGWGYGDWPGPVWHASMFVIPNYLYNYYGDKTAIEKIYPAAERYLEMQMKRENKDGFVPEFMRGIGDWCYYRTTTPQDFVSSCYYYYQHKLMARFAELLGRDGAKYEAKAKQLCDYINAKYLNRETGFYSVGKITAQALPLAMGLVPEDMEQLVASRLNEVVIASGYLCDFGLVGSKYALRMLVKYGYVDTAYRLATQTKVPSFGAWIANGYTSPLERWRIGSGPRFGGAASANHVFFGDVAAWMQSDIAGINYDEAAPGFGHIIIRPHYPEGLEWAEASLRTVRGKVVSSWKREGGNIVLNVTIPVNAKATIYADKAYEVEGTGRAMNFVFAAQ